MSGKANSPDEPTGYGFDVDFEFVEKTD